MKRFTALIAGIIIGATGMYFAFTIVVVQSASGTNVIQKTQPSLAELAYVDVTNWDAEEWAKHPELQRDLINTGHADLIKSPAGVEIIKDVFGKVKESLEQ